MKTKSVNSALKKLLIVSSIAISSLGAVDAAVIFNDDFIGGAGDAPNPSYWVSTSGITLSGDGLADLDTASGAQYLQSLAGFRAAPSEGLYALATWSLTDMGGGNKVFGLNDGQFSGPSILIRNDLGNGVYTIVVEGANGGTGEFATSVSSSFGGATGQWAIAWSLTSISVTLNDSLIFDSSVNGPTGGGSWEIPTGDLRPAIQAYTGGGVVIGVDSVKWETVAIPEPSSFALLGAVGAMVGCLALRRKK